MNTQVLNSIVSPLLTTLAEQLVEGAFREPTWPLDIEAAVALTLPADIVFLSHLRPTALAQWLSSQGIEFAPSFQDRSLRGCILAHKGVALIFVDSCLEAAERRFTVAHEAAHLVLDYLRPRQRAVEALGPSIKEVLDGERTATTEELVHGILDQCPIRPYSHMFEPGEIGNADHHTISESESAADALALEILAPASVVLGELGLSNSSRPYGSVMADCRRILDETFGIKNQEAHRYARRICNAFFGPPGVLRSMGLD